MRTENRYLLWMLLGLVAWSWFTSQASATPIVSMKISNEPVFVGDTVQVDVLARNVTEVDPQFGFDALLAFGFDLNFDSDGLDLKAVSVGSPFIDVSDLIFETDVAGLACLDVFGEEILLASLNFTAASAGGFSVGISSDLTDPNEGLITWLYPQLDLTQKLSLQIDAAPAPVPEPATLLLVGSGLIGFMGLRRKRSQRSKNLSDHRISNKAQGRRLRRAVRP